MSVVFLFTLFVSVSVSVFFFVILFFCCFSKSSCVFSSVVLFSILLWFTISKIVVRLCLFVYGHTNTFLLPCCAFSLPYVRKNHTAHTLHYMMIRSHIYELHYTCVAYDSSCYSFKHTTSMPSSNSMDNKNVHTGFAISIWGAFFTFPSISILSLSVAPLCKCRHKSHIYLIDTKPCMMYVLYMVQTFLPILVWARKKWGRWGSETALSSSIHKSSSIYKWLMFEQISIHKNTKHRMWAMYTYSVHIYSCRFDQSWYDFDSCQTISHTFFRSLPPSLCLILARTKQSDNYSC